MADLVPFLVIILIIVVSGAVGWWIIQNMGLPNPIYWIAKLVLGAILLIALLTQVVPYLPG